MGGPPLLDKMDIMESLAPLRVCEGITDLHRHGIELLEDVAEVGLVDLVTPHGEVVEVEDGGPVL